MLKTGENLFKTDTKIEKAYQIVSGRVRVSWKWGTWDRFFLDPGSFIGVMESLEPAKSVYEVQAVEETMVETFTKEQILNASSLAMKSDVIRSLLLLTEQIVQQKYIGLPLSDQEKMYSVFETFIRKADKSRAISCYSRFISVFPSSPFIDKMLHYIQNISLGNDITAEIANNEEEAFSIVQTQSQEMDPQQNLILLKKFEEKFPHSVYNEVILDSILSEYEKLGDEYQLNFYLRKFLFSFPSSTTTPKKLLLLVSIQRRNGEPAWYENALRFLIHFPDSEFVLIIKKYLGIDI